MSDSELSLDGAILGAGEAPPSVRIEFRDPIARHGSAGIARVVPWLKDPKMAAFAIRVITRAADFGASVDAREALRTSLAVLTEPARSDALLALAKLGVRPGERRANRSTTSKQTAAADAEASLDELIEGRVYKRVELHNSGLGGNRQKGISYPAGGTYVLLFSDPDTAAEWGYHDRWAGADTYRYYGEWDGTGDMLIRGGNLAIVERSPEIYLFVKAPSGHRYAGTFECVSQEQVLTTRDGQEFVALVFTLERRGSGQSR